MYYHSSFTKLSRQKVSTKLLPTTKWQHHKPKEGYNHYFDAKNQKNRCTIQWWPLSPLSTHSDLKSEKSAILSKEAPTLTFFEIFFLTSHIHTYLFHYFTFLVQCAIFGKIFHFAAKKIDCTMVIFLCVTILNRIFYWTQTTLQKMPFSRKLVKKFFVREKEK